jgi:adenylyl-sulfate kinase
VVWLTGLSAAGKSTLAAAVHQFLHERGLRTIVLDGDHLRRGLCSDLGFSDEDRLENLRRAAEVACLMAAAGIIVLCAFISPFAEQRRRLRSRCEGEGLPFLEVFVNAPIAVCEQRDPKGLYSQARSGRITTFTGIDSPYEPPVSADLIIPTDTLTINDSARQLIEAVLRKCHLSVTLGGHANTAPLPA